MSDGQTEREGENWLICKACNITKFTGPEKRPNVKVFALGEIGF